MWIHGPGVRFPPALQKTVSMRRIIEIALVSLGMSMMSVSCSIKEDRTPCPCWLDIFLPETSSSAVNLSLWQGSDQLLGGEFDAKSFVPFLEKEVRRGFNRLSAYEKKGALSLSGACISISPGGRCDSVYAYCDVVDCTGEFALDTVIFHKQFATLTLQIINPQEVTYPYTMTVKGNVNGMTLADLQPTEGEFQYSPLLDQNSLGTCRLPRQKDSSLTIEMFKSDDGTLVDTIPLGYMIERTGYNWHSEDLEDITIKIDFAKAEIIVKVNQWQSEYTYEIEI